MNRTSPTTTGNPAKAALRHHVTGAIQRGEAKAIGARPAPGTLDINQALAAIATGQPVAPGKITPFPKPAVPTHDELLASLGGPPPAVPAVPEAPPRRTGLVAFLTGSTCGDPCWHAREEVCRCSCGGANHGCLLSGGAEQPVRTSRLGGEMFTLHGTGTYAEMEKLASDIGWNAQKQKLSGWVDKMPHYPAVRKAASDAQIRTWPELRSYREKAMNPLQRMQEAPHLLWVRMEVFRQIQPAL